MNTKYNKLAKRKLSVRKKIASGDYRLSVSRSSKYLFAQIIKTADGQTVLGAVDKKYFLESKKKQTKLEKAEIFGEKFAQEVIKKGIKKVTFDRSGHLYHGRIQAFAQGARKGGLHF